MNKGGAACACPASPLPSHELAHVGDTHLQAPHALQRCVDLPLRPQSLQTLRRTQHVCCSTLAKVGMRAGGCSGAPQTGVRAAEAPCALVEDTTHMVGGRNSKSVQVGGAAWRDLLSCRTLRTPSSLEQAEMGPCGLCRGGAAHLWAPSTRPCP